MEDRLYLWEIFKDDVAELEKMLGRDLSHWNPTIKKAKVSFSHTMIHWFICIL